MPERPLLIPPAHPELIWWEQDGDQLVYQPMEARLVRLDSFLAVVLRNCQGQRLPELVQKLALPGPRAQGRRRLMMAVQALSDARLLLHPFDAPRLRWALSPEEFPRARRLNLAPTPKLEPS